MQHQCVSARFEFWDGKKQYTVEYTYGLKMWFIFNNDERTNCIHKTKVGVLKSVNAPSAEIILYQFLESN